MTGTRQGEEFTVPLGLGRLGQHLPVQGVARGREVQVPQVVQEEQARFGAPAERFGGSATFSVFRRGVTSTPRSAGLNVSSVFFFAFMMLGSVT